MPPRALPRRLAHNFTRHMTLEGHCSTLAVESNSISLDPDVKDAWGLPATRVTWTIPTTRRIASTSTTA